MRIRTLAGTLALCAGLVPQLALAQGAAQERRYALADHGFLVLQVPAGWQEQVRRRDETMPPTVFFTPASGAQLQFQVVLTALWPMKPGIKEPTAEELKRIVLNAAERVKDQVVEKSIDTVELKAPGMLGYYFRVTDRAPKADEYKYMTQGMLSLGEVRVTFTILTNDGHEAADKAALAMLRAARHVR